MMSFALLPLLPPLLSPVEHQGGAATSADPTHEHGTHWPMHRSSAHKLLHKYTIFSLPCSMDYY
jgi:hypothetical protein